MASTAGTLSALTLAFFAGSLPSKAKALKMFPSNWKEIIEQSDGLTVEKRAMLLSWLVVVSTAAGKWGAAKDFLRREWLSALRAYSNVEFKENLNKMLGVSTRWPHIWVLGCSEVESWLDMVDFRKLSYDEGVLDTLETFPQHWELLRWMMHLSHYRHTTSVQRRRKVVIVEKVLQPHLCFILEKLETPEDFVIVLGYVKFLKGLKEQLKERWMTKKLRMRERDYYVHTKQLIRAFVLDNYNNFQDCTKEEQKMLMKWLILDGQQTRQIDDDIKREAGRNVRLGELLSMGRLFGIPFTEGVRQSFEERPPTEEEKTAFVFQVQKALDEERTADDGKKRAFIFGAVRYACQLLSGRENIDGILSWLVAFTNGLETNVMDEMPVRSVSRDLLKEWRRWNSITDFFLFPKNRLTYSFKCGENIIRVEWTFWPQSPRLFDVDRVPEGQKVLARMQNWLFGSWTNSKEGELREMLDGLQGNFYVIMVYFLKVLCFKHKKLHELRGIVPSIWENEPFRNFVHSRGQLKDLLEEKEAEVKLAADKLEMDAGVKRKMEEAFEKEVERKYPEHLAKLKRAEKLRWLMEKPVASCPVCLCFYGKEFLVRNVPCGHVFCKDCQVKMKTCGMCRQPVVSTVKVVPTPQFSV